ncbi:MAG: DUF1343 domain-containing protein [Treponema sp.]|jgi:uncharacterized protein YbbC (DUF1343 family)|nr:DUF1343 domain-containing protein [Treponema sp.]
MTFGGTVFWELDDTVLKSGRIGVLCNQAAWHIETGEYIFETLYRRGNLRLVFMPEHGLFGELQDQVKLDRTEPYRKLGLEKTEFVSLYGSDENSLSPRLRQLEGLDALVIELQDSGARYYTFLATLYFLFKVIAASGINLPVYLLDRENPAGRFVEGSALPQDYASFIGLAGLPHRYGLTIGELAWYFYDELDARFPLHIVSYKARYKAGGSSARLAPWLIPPSPNFPSPYTAFFYSGQCLWEGCNVSEGRGTTRPFEVFGAPFMESLIDYNRVHGYEGWNDSRHPLYGSGAFLRWHRFIPVFHKYSNECCFGFQLILNPSKPYHALAHALKIVRFTAENCEDFVFRPGKYEAGNDRTAIELLAGDPLLLDYLNGRTGWESAAAHLRNSEQAWIDKTKKYLLYGEELIRGALCGA